MKEDISLYVHYPFCTYKCPYCDFNSYGLGIRGVDDFFESYLREISHYSEIFGDRTIKTVFFGGGTPSLMSSGSLGGILDRIDEKFRLDRDAEISLEANPTTLETKKFSEFRSLGINRLSVGVQSLNSQQLKFFGKTYGRGEILRALDVVQKCFGENYSIDLIYARPEQNVQQWLEELEEATILSPNHLSLYQLTIEPGTKFYRDGIRALEDNMAAEMYEMTNKFLESRGLHLYEISNYARDGYECRHNLNYWNSGEWLGIGAGAHSRLCFEDIFINKYKERTALENIKNPQKWQQSVANYGHGVETREILAREEFIEEVLLMGLRLGSGLRIDNVKKYLTLGPGGVLDLLGGSYRYLSDSGSIEVSDQGLRVPPEYLRVLDSIVERIIK
ncbi:MAG: radical SAM family heme chaperone HemW [Rickettsiales bacterium]|jgi:oxygen-independent coproporphyrinogen-3 oxidase|nr:radical SAM family heme chaperone HemW [Rickettsiales bacterium]